MQVLFAAFPHVPLLNRALIEILNSKCCTNKKSSSTSGNQTQDLQTQSCTQTAGTPTSGFTCTGYSQKNLTAGKLRIPKSKKRMFGETSSFFSFGLPLKPLRSCYSSESFSKVQRRNHPSPANSQSPLKLFIKPNIPKEQI